MDPMVGLDCSLGKQNPSTRYDTLLTNRYRMYAGTGAPLRRCGSTFGVWTVVDR